MVLICVRVRSVPRSNTVTEYPATVADESFTEIFGYSNPVDAGCVRNIGEQSSMLGIDDLDVTATRNEQMIASSVIRQVIPSLVTSKHESFPYRVVSRQRRPAADRADSRR